MPLNFIDGCDCPECTRERERRSSISSVPEYRGPAIRAWDLPQPLQMARPPVLPPKKETLRVSALKNRYYVDAPAINPTYIGKRLLHPKRRFPMPRSRWGTFFRYFTELRRDNKDRGKRIATFIHNKDWLGLWAMPDGIPVRVATKVPKDVMQAIENAQRKFDSGTWLRPEFTSDFVTVLSPTQREMFKSHFVHVSNEDPLQIAFAESLDKLMQDRFTRVKPGRYLQRYYGDVLTTKQIKSMSERYVVAHGPVTVKIAKTEGEIIKAIAEGPSDSCMSNRFYENKQWFYGHIHPAAAYAGSGDFEVAYLENPKGEITARVVCNAKKKQMARCYGDVNRMLPAMEKLGYQQVSLALNGLRLRVIENTKDNGGFIIPYVDAGYESGGGALWAHRDGEWWVTQAGKSVGAINTYDGYNNHGVVQGNNALLGDDEGHPDEIICADCNEACNTDYSYSVMGGSSVCEDCADNYNQAYVGRTQQALVHQESCHYCEDTDNYYLDDSGVYRIHNLVWDHDGNLRRKNLVVSIDGVYYDRGQVEQLSERLYGPDTYELRDESVETPDGDWIREDDAVEVKTFQDKMVFGTMRPVLAQIGQFYHTGDVDEVTLDGDTFFMTEDEMNKHPEKFNPQPELEAA